MVYKIKWKKSLCDETENEITIEAKNYQDAYNKLHKKIGRVYAYGIKEVYNEPS